MDACDNSSLAMTGFDILFETDRFNVSEVKEHFINPCCFGEDLAEWLRQKLTEKGVAAGTPGQEDWGWYLHAQHGPDRYFLGFSGYPRPGGLGGNDGEWRFMVLKKRSIWEKLRGRNTITDTEPILLMIEDILRAQADFRNVSREFSSL
jgi:hypothetical protein